MGKVVVENLREGMILNADVTDGDQILIPSGTPLTERHFKLCRSWGIRELHIQGVDNQQIEDEFFSKLPEVALNSARQKANLLFALANREHPAMQTLYQIHLKRLLEKKQPSK